MRWRLPEWAVGLLFISPWLVGFGAFMALPIALSFWYSLSDYTILEPPVYVGLENYQRLAEDPVFWKVMWNTVIYAVIAIPLGTIFALVIAGLLNAKVIGLTFFRAAVFLPSLVPLVASAMIWIWIFNGENGLLNGALELIGIRGPNWLGEAAWMMPSLVIISLWSIGQAVVIYLAALQDVPTSLYEAADLDGMGVIGKFWNVTIPMISPVILFNVIMAIIATWQIFAVPFIISLDGGPERSGYFYTMYLYDQAFRFLNMGVASAMAWVQLLIILGLTGLTFLVSRRTVHYRA
ncbi:MAG: sugar ABC transporter permease [Planctomycetota bacterium]